MFFIGYVLRKNCPDSKLFWPIFYRMNTENAVWMRENTDQNSSRYGHFSRSVIVDMIDFMAT